MNLAGRDHEVNHGVRASLPGGAPRFQRQRVQPRAAPRQIPRLRRTAFRA